MDVELPNGMVIEGVPEGTTKEQLVEKLRAKGHDTAWYKPETSVPPSKQKREPFEAPMETGVRQFANAATYGAAPYVSAGVRGALPIGMGGTGALGRDIEAGHKQMGTPGVVRSIPVVSQGADVLAAIMSRGGAYSADVKGQIADWEGKEKRGWKENPGASALGMLVGAAPSAAKGATLLKKPLMNYKEAAAPVAATWYLLNDLLKRAGITQ